jgi:hypothetical protein
MRPIISPSIGATIIGNQQKDDTAKYTKVAEGIEKLMIDNNIKNHEIQNIIEIYSNRHSQRIQNMPIADEIEIMKDYEYIKANVSPKPQ